ncbi:MAG: glycosyltransferase family 2 protein [Chloroflexi bacterium]|nr:glycosyltransferase family 2 protein [Chloroflexota bacterium]
MPDRTGVTLVIPAWNEAEAIGGVLDEVPPGLVDEVLVVVGAEADPTGAVAAAHGARVLVQTRPGYGAACWTGAEEALRRNADVVAFLDGDYADPPEALARLLAPIRDDRADLVLGCRDLRRYPHALPPHARLGNALVCGLMRCLLRTDFRDLPSYKVIRATALRQLDMREMTYGWTVEMLAKAARAHLRIEQIPVEYRPRRGGRSKVAGDPRGSLLAAYKLLACALTYATSRQWSVVGGQ